MGCHFLLQGILLRLPHCRQILYLWATREVLKTLYTLPMHLSLFPPDPWQLLISWTVDCQSPLPLGFSRQEYQSGLLCPSPGDLPYPGVEPLSLMYPALAGWSFTTSAIWEAHCLHGFPFTRISYSWNYTEYRLFKLTSFTWEYAFKISPCLFMTW